MKNFGKGFVFMAILLVFGAGLASAQSWTSKAPDNFSVKLPKNQYDKGYQVQIDAEWLFNGNQMKKGEKYELELEFTSDNDVPELQVALVDGSAAANYWKVLSKETVTPAVIAPPEAILNVTAKTPTKAKITFTIYHDSKGASKAANKLVFDTKPAKKMPTITFTKLTLKKL